MDQLPVSPSYVTWLLGQSVAVVVLVAWVMSLHRLLKRSSERIRELEQRNDELCDSSAELVRSHSQERAADRETTLRTVLESLEKSLLGKRSG